MGTLTLSMSERKAYDELFNSKLTTSNIEALDVLFTYIWPEIKDSAGRPPLRLHHYVYLGLYTICVILKPRTVQQL
jgi:hypothetical protein